MTGVVNVVLCTYKLCCCSRPADRSCQKVAPPAHQSFPTGRDPFMAVTTNAAPTGPSQPNCCSGRTSKDSAARLLQPSELQQLLLLPPRHRDPSLCPPSVRQGAPGPAHLLQGRALPHVLFVQLLHQVLDHIGLDVEQDVPPVVASHHAVLQQEQQVTQGRVHVQHVAHGRGDTKHAQLNGGGKGKPASGTGSKTFHKTHWMAPGDLQLTDPKTPQWDSPRPA